MVTRNRKFNDWRVQQELLHAQPRNKRFMSVYAQPKFPVFEACERESRSSEYVFWGCLLGIVVLLSVNAWWIK